MKRRPLLILILLLAFHPLTSCKGRRGVPPSLTYETKVLERKEGDCQGSQENCSKVKFSYPEFKGGGDTKALEQINAAVQSFLLTPLSPDRAAKNFEEFAKSFFQDRATAIKEFPQMPSAWYLERIVSVEFFSPQTLGLQMLEDQYMGGAHPNSSRQYVNFNPATGSRYSLSDFLVPDFQVKLTAIAEKIFRQKQEIPPQENLEKAGYFFEKGIFKLNDNFLIRPTGLTFLFNPYEVAAYVVGPIEFEIPYSDLQDLMLPGGVLAKTFER